MFIERFTLVLLMPPILIIELPEVNGYTRSSSFLFRAFTYILLHLLPFMAFLAAECNYACTFQCGCSVCLALMPFPFVHQSKGWESPLHVSFKPTGFGIGLKPPTLFYQASYNWKDFVEGIL